MTPTLSNNSTAHLLHRDFMERVSAVVLQISAFHDAPKAYELAKRLGKNIQQHKAEVSKDKVVANFYQKIMVKLRFVALSLLDDSEIIELFRNYFTWQFRLPDYDLPAALEGKLLNYLVLEDRDALKDKLRQALLENREVIASQADSKTIADWLKNYNAAVGLQVADPLKKNQWLAGLKSNKQLSDHDRQKLQTLVTIYEMCKLSSLTPQGFEERPPIVIDGKLYIFNRGILEQVKPSKEVERILQANEPSLREGNASIASVSDADSDNVSSLAQMAEQYPQGSLERRAIEEEMKRLGQKKSTP